MVNMNQEITVIAFASSAVVIIILFIIVIAMWRKLNTIKRKYDAMINDTGVANLEEVLTLLQQKQSVMEERAATHELAIQQMKGKVAEMTGNVSIQRYNAFNESGSDMSFSIAFVNDELDGLVLTSIHGRDETYSYGKPLIKGESKYPLSPEEVKVINLARSKSQYFA